MKTCSNASEVRKIKMKTIIKDHFFHSSSYQKIFYVMASVWVKLVHFLLVGAIEFFWRTYWKYLFKLNFNEASTIPTLIFSLKQ